MDSGEFRLGESSESVNLAHFDNFTRFIIITFHMDGAGRGLTCQRRERWTTPNMMHIDSVCSLKLLSAIMIFFAVAAGNLKIVIRRFFELRARE